MSDGAKLCSCGLPRGTRKDGSARKDRYCAKCRRDYEKNWRDAKKRELAELRKRVRELLKNDDYARQALAGLVSTVTAPIERGA